MTRFVLISFNPLCIVHQASSTNFPLQVAMENLSKLKNDDGLRLLEYFLSPYLLGTKFVTRSFKWLLGSKKCYYVFTAKYSGLPRQIFQYSGGHIPGVPPLTPPCSILQNPGKTTVLGVLPPVAALVLILESCNFQKKKM